MCVPTNLLTPGIDMHLTFELDLINWITFSTYRKRYLFLIKMFFLSCTFFKLPLDSLSCLLLMNILTI